MYMTYNDAYCIYIYVLYVYIYINMYIYGCHDVSRAGDGNRGLGMSDWF